MWCLTIWTLLQSGAEIFIDWLASVREMFRISSRIFSFNFGLLLKTLLKRYSQRKKSIGDMSGLRVGQLMSPLFDIQKFHILNTMSRCDMLPQVGFCTVVNVNLCVEYGLKMFWARFKMLDCFRVENSGCSWTDALPRTAFSGSRNVLGRPDSGRFIVEPISLKFCNYFLINWIDGASFLCSML